MHNPSPTESPQTEPRAAAATVGRPKRMLLAIAGSIAVGLAFLGAALPLLPTAPFVLLAGICFAKSWPRADAWLHRHTLFGPFRRMRPGQATMTRRFQVIAIAITVASFGATLLLTNLALVWQLLLIAVCAFIAIFLARQPTVTP